jgi:phosphoglycolate phosphatase
MSEIEVIVFDYDGTLFDTRPAILHCIQRALAACGRPIPALEIVANTVKTGLPLQETFVVLDAGLHTDRIALNNLIGIYRELYLDESTPLLKPFAGVGKVLQRTQGAGTKNAVVSNKGIAAIRQSLDQWGLTSLVDWVFADELGLPKKPDPAIMIDHILPRYAPLQKAQILMVGDTEADILFAKNAGIACCWASYGYGEIERCRALSPEHEISDIAELPAIVYRSKAAPRDLP